jgi:serine/threonine protein kinase
LPNLLPVKVEESTAKHWFASLASAVEFMHNRGVVHNDIK